MVNGGFVPKKAYLDCIPVNGFYKYKTSPNQLGEWIMTGEIFIHRILSDEEVRSILISEGYTPMLRKKRRY